MDIHNYQRRFERTLDLKKGLLINFPYPDSEEPEIEEVSI